jgi:hypothetical protein
MITPNSLHYPTPDPAEALAGRVIAGLSDAPPNRHYGGALADWCHSKVRWIASPHIPASVIHKAAALPITHLTKQAESE